eukprot:774823-Pyramimonas_sp.AAC.6
MVGFTYPIGTGSSGFSRSPKLHRPCELVLRPLKHALLLTLNPACEWGVRARYRISKVISPYANRLEWPHGACRT